MSKIRFTKFISNYIRWSKKCAVIHHNSFFCVNLFKIIGIYSSKSDIILNEITKFTQEQPTQATYTNLKVDRQSYSFFNSLLICCSS